MLVAFQIGTAFYGTDLLATHHLRTVLAYFGITAAVLPAVLVVLVLFVQHLLAKEPWQLRPEVFAGMAGESILWMGPLAVMMGLAGRLQAGGGVNKAEQVLRGVLQAFGAGIYEEFIFRLMLISLIVLVFVDIMALNKEAVVIAAVVLTAVAFSLYHLSGEQISHFPTLPWAKVIFRAAAGLYLGGLFLCRGFGIAVGAHACYNIYVQIVDLH